MIQFAQSTQTLHLHGALSKSQDLIADLERLASSEAIAHARLEVSGWIKELELAQFNPDKGSWERLFAGDDGYEIAQGKGTIGLLAGKPVIELWLLVFTRNSLGQSMAYGQVQKAAGGEVDFKISIAEDLEFTYTLDGKRGTRRLEKVVAVEDSSSETKTRSSKQDLNDEQEDLDVSTDDNSETDTASLWASMAQSQKRVTDTASPSAVRKSAKEPEDYYQEESVTPQIGDTLNHSELGRCRIIRIEDDDVAQIRLPRGKIRKLKLSLLNVEFVGEDEITKKNLFNVSMKK